MTLERLQQYLPEQRERAECQGELQELLHKRTSDTVIGSSPEPPYIKHTITVRGMSGENIRRIEYLRSKLRLLDVRSREVERWVDGLDDMQLRRIIRYRYLTEHRFRPTWQRVAEYIGGNNTADSVRMKAKRFFAER